MKKLLSIVLTALSILAPATSNADTPPQVINKLCSANQFFSQIQPGPNNINCTQPTYSGIANTPTFAQSVQIATNVVTLVGDSASPGNSKFYGTNSSGTRGYYNYTTDVNTIGTIDGNGALPNGASISGSTLYMQSAGSTVPGLVNNAAQSFSGEKSFDDGIYSPLVTSLADDLVLSSSLGIVIVDGNISANNLSGTNTGDVTLGTANGLSLIGQALSLGLSSNSTTGALSSTDWNTFNNKQPSGNYITSLTTDVVATGPGAAAATIQPGVVTNSKLATMAARTVKANVTAGVATPTDVTLGTMTESTSSVLTLSNWAFATLGSPTIQVKLAGAAQSGYLSSTDWNTFNNKQPAGDYIENEGNSFGAPIVIGSNDSFSVGIETEGETRALYDTDGFYRLGISAPIYLNIELSSNFLNFTNELGKGPKTGTAIMGNWYASTANISEAPAYGVTGMITRSFDSNSAQEFDAFYSAINSIGKFGEIGEGNVYENQTTPMGYAGVTGALPFLDDGDAGTMYIYESSGFYVPPTANNTGQSKYGLFVGDISGADQSNYAIFTNGGLVSFGDNTQIPLHNLTVGTTVPNFVTNERMSVLNNVAGLSFATTAAAGSFYLSRFDNTNVSAQATSVLSGSLRQITNNTTDTGDIVLFRGTSAFTVPSTRTYTNTNATAGYVGVKVDLPTVSGGGAIAITRSSGVQVLANSTNTGATKVGLDIGSLSGSTTNLAISTGTGLVRLGDQIQGVSGSAGTPTYSFTNDTDSGIFSVGAGNISFSVDGTERFRMRPSGMIGVDGTNALPTYSFLNDTNTGVYSAGSDVLGFTTGGTLRVSIGSSGNVGIGSSPSTASNLNLAGVTLSGTSQYGVTIGQNSGSAATVSTIGIQSAVSTAAASYTTGYRAQFQSSNTSKGSGSTITRDIAYLMDAPSQGTNNANISDNITFTGNWFLNSTSANPSTVSGYFQIGNQADPGAPTDAVRLGSSDISAGNSTLYLRTETAVAADIGLASTNSLTVFINGAKYKIPLVLVP